MRRNHRNRYLLLLWAKPKGVPSGSGLHEVLDIKSSMLKLHPKDMEALPFWLLLLLGSSL